MKSIVALTFLLLAVADCQKDHRIYFPDQWESVGFGQNQNRLNANGQLVLPDFQSTVQNVNDVEAPPQSSNGGFSQGLPPLTTNQEPLVTSSLPTRPSATPFDTFLPPKWRDHVLGILARGITKFTLDIDRAIENSSSVSRDNVVFSPASLTVTLAMILLASGGKTFEEVARILGLESGVDISHHSEIVHQLIGLLVREGDLRQILDPNLPQTKFAFGIFVEDGFPIREQFRAVSEKVYKGDIVSVDFSHHNKEAQKLINKWVSDKTMGKIQSMLADAPSPMTDVIITSAMYFSGEWEQHFMAEGTRRKPFQVNDNETIEVDMMTNGGEFMFYEDPKLGAKIIKFPYKGGETAMYAVLPNKPGTDAMKELKNQLTPENLDGMIDKMVNSSCIIGYPKMKLSSTLLLQSALEALGLKSLFDPASADLSVLSPGRGSQENSSSTHQPTQQTASPSPSQHQQQPSSPFTGGFRKPTKASRLVEDRENYFRYEDEDGYAVEQWDTGYKIQKLNRRAKRQQPASRPIDQEFVDFLNSQKLPNFGVDDLRNTAGISNPGLYADEVIHKVEMTVNEKGTEAAAATSVILDRTGTFKRFIANRPFFFFIRHDPAKAIWFWATINRPSPYFPSQ